MESHDDPEARIRALERRLADAARTSELGVDHYSSDGATTPAPLPPYGAPDGAPYAAPYGAPPRKVTAGFRQWPWVLAMIAVFLVVLGVSAAFIMIDNTSTREGSVVAGGGGPFDQAPDRQPGIPGGSVDSPQGGLPGIPDGESVTTAPPGEVVSVAGIRENKTVACDGGSVNVSGVSNTVTITGHCVRVNVSGVENLVTVDTTDAIGASGLRNRVTYRFGSPQIRNSGGSNFVEQG